MNPSSKSNNEQKPTKNSHHHDAWSGWGAIIGITGGVVIGLFCQKAILLGFILGAIGWFVGAMIDRGRQ